MKIFEIARFNNLIKIINESISLSDLRKKLIKNEISVSEEEKEWYENSSNKKSLMDIINTIVGPTADKKANEKLKSFNTENYFKKGVIKPKSLKNELTLKLISVMSDDTEEKLEDQYEKISLNDNIDIYAVYTPKANVALSHKILKSNQIPTWCIASPSSSTKYWAHYNLWDAKYPSVFIIVKKGTTFIKAKDKNGEIKEDETTDKPLKEEVTNLKYEIMCRPEYGYSPIYNFLKGRSSFEDIVTECRDALQHEKEYSESSLFEYMDITKEDVENTMRRLLSSKKSEDFCLKYGKDNYDKIKYKSNSENEETRLSALIQASKMGFLSEISTSINNSKETDFFILNLIKHNNLYEHDLNSMFYPISKDVMEKSIEFLIKNKRCSYTSLNFCIKYNLNNLFNKVFHSLEVAEYNLSVLEIVIKNNHDELIKPILDKINDGDKEREILALLVNKKKYFDYYLDKLLEKDIANNDILSLVIRQSDEKNVLKVLKKMMQKEDGISSYTLSLLLQENKIDLAKNVLKFLDENGDIYHTDLEYLLKYKNEELINFALTSMFNNSNIDDFTFFNLIKNGYKKYADKVFDYLLKVFIKKNNYLFFLQDLIKLDDLGYFTRAFEELVKTAPNKIEKSILERFIFEGNDKIKDFVMNILIENQWKLKDLLDISLNWRKLNKFILPILKLMKKKGLIDKEVEEKLDSENKKDLLNEI